MSTMGFCMRCMHKKTQSWDKNITQMVMATPWNLFATLKPHDHGVQTDDAIFNTVIVIATYIPLYLDLV